MVKADLLGMSLKMREAALLLKGLTKAKPPLGDETAGTTELCSVDSNMDAPRHPPAVLHRGDDDEPHAYRTRFL